MSDNVIKRNELLGKLALKISGAQMQRSSKIVKTKKIDQVSEMIRQEGTHPGIMADLLRMKEEVQKKNKKNKKSKPVSTEPNTE